MKAIIKLFWRLTTDKFLQREFDDHNAILREEYSLISEQEEAEIKNLLNSYIIPEMLRRGL